MGCNCGKKRKRPAQVRPKPDEKQDQQQGQGKTQAFTLTTQMGRTLRFGSKLEAEAANARSGGAGTVQPSR